MSFWAHFGAILGQKGFPGGARGSQKVFPDSTSSRTGAIPGLECGQLYMRRRNVGIRRHLLEPTCNGQFTTYSP